MPESQHILDTLLRLMRLIRRSYDTQAEAMGLTLSRARALTTLSRMDGVTQAELATALGIEAPTLKRQVDALEAAGFVIRRPSREDGRKNALFLTDRGRDHAIVEFTHRMRRDLLDGISPQELDSATTVLNRITENIAKLGRS
ncbi:MarR family transcriptional regulator [Paracoccus sp. DMF-8]|uniref:MarR family winged helix-turn-helix transcriptional regulator n=1 Tax=Paracoccus sp. DMF-8 TaxID=3019445 RepID=UPI0023E37EFD|nr:MarR family transcriptional regulator [Paracoccus sp. DMF-8]MDF3608430.1 MarR family transcriptional regulator [Paracoccus sp. DMF-8]